MFDSAFATGFFFGFTACVFAVVLWGVLISASRGNEPIDEEREERSGQQ